MYVTDIINGDGSVNRTEWEFRQYHYVLIGTAAHPHFSTPWKSRDMIRRSDGMIFSISRSMLFDYFSGKTRSRKELEIDMKIIANPKKIEQ